MTSYVSNSELGQLDADLDCGCCCLQKGSGGGRSHDDDRASGIVEPQGDRTFLSDLLKACIGICAAEDDELSAALFRETYGFFKGHLPCEGGADFAADALAAFAGLRGLAEDEACAALYNAIEMSVSAKPN